MDKIDMLLVSTAAYVAVVSLVRLMAYRRDQVIRHLQAEMERQNAARAAAAAEEDREAA